MMQLPEDQAEILRWWYHRQLEGDLSMNALAREAGIAPSSFSRAFNGSYGADLASLCVTLGKAKDNLSLWVPNPDFITTALARQMYEIFDDTRALQTVQFIWGVKGIGKTEVSFEYKRTHNHGKTHYYRCQPGLTFTQFVMALATAMGISNKRYSTYQIREAIVEMLRKGKRLLIIDELHQLFLKDKGKSAVLICEFLREAYDRSRCGLALIGTRAMISEFMEGNNAPALEQLLDRGEEPVELPGKPTRADAAAFIEHFGLKVPDLADPEAAQLIKDIFEASGLRKLTTHLRAGAQFAARLQEQYAWKHFVAAHARRAGLAKKKTK